MELDNPEARAFLAQLFVITGSDMDNQASMYDIGDALGLEKTEAGDLAQMLFVQGFAELKTLSGGIGITQQGLAALGEKIKAVDGDDHVLGSHTVLTQEDRDAIDALQKSTKQMVPGLGLEYEQMEELMIDMKTIDVQMLSEKPKTSVIRELFLSLHHNLHDCGEAILLKRLSALVGAQ